MSNTQIKQFDPGPLPFLPQMVKAAHRVNADGESDLKIHICTDPLEEDISVFYKYGWQQQNLLKNRLTSNDLLKTRVTVLVTY